MKNWTIYLFFTIFFTLLASISSSLYRRHHITGINEVSIEKSEGIEDAILNAENACVIEVVNKEIQNINSGDIGKYIPVKIGDFSVLFKIESEFQNLHTLLSGSTTTYHSSINSLSQNNYFDQHSNQYCTYELSYKKDALDLLTLKAAMYAPYTTFEYKNPKMDYQSNHAKIVYNKLFVMENYVQNIKSSDVGKFILVELNELPIAFQIAGQFNDDWNDHIHKTHPYAVIKGRGFVKIVFYNHNGEEIGPTLLNTFNASNEYAAVLRSRRELLAEQKRRDEENAKRKNVLRSDKKVK